MTCHTVFINVQHNQTPLYNAEYYKNNILLDFRLAFLYVKMVFFVFCFNHYKLIEKSKFFYIESFNI